MLKFQSIFYLQFTLPKTILYFCKFSFSVQTDAESAKENIKQHFNKMATELSAFKKFKTGETTDPSKEASAAGVGAK
jgi:hypothetical protein